MEDKKHHLIDIFEKPAFKEIKSENAKDFIKRLLTPTYKKLYDPDEFCDEAENDDCALGKRHTFDPSVEQIGGLRMTALKALSHPWMEDISIQLIDNLINKEKSEAKKIIRKGVLDTIQKYKKEETRDAELIKRSCLSIIAGKLISPQQF